MYVIAAYCAHVSNTHRRSEQDNIKGHGTSYHHSPRPGVLHQPIPRTVLGLRGLGQHLCLRTVIVAQLGGRESWLESSLSLEEDFISAQSLTHCVIEGLTMAMSAFMQISSQRQ